MDLPTIVPLVATETQVHRTQVTKASCPQVHGGAVGLETLPMGLPQEFKRTRPPVLEDDCRKIFHLSTGSWAPQFPKSSSFGLLFPSVSSRHLHLAAANMVRTDKGLFVPGFLPRRLKC